MASIRKEFDLPVSADAAWALLREFGAVDRLAAGFVTACALEEDGAVRRVTFFNGYEARERLVTLDEEARRIVYSAIGGRLTHHNASAQVEASGAANCRFVWTTDLLPDAMAPAIGQMMEQGAQAIRSALTRPST